MSLRNRQRGERAASLCTRVTAGVLMLLAIVLSATAGDAAKPKVVRLPSMTAPDGKQRELNAPKGGVAVVVFLSPECPISNGYSATLNQIAAEFAGKPLRMTGVCVDPDLTDKDVTAHVRDFQLKFVVVRDPRGAAAGRSVRRSRPKRSCSMSRAVFVTAAASTTSTPPASSATPTPGRTNCATQSPPCWPVAKSPTRMSRRSAVPWPSVAIE